MKLDAKVNMLGTKMRITSEFGESRKTHKHTGIDFVTAEKKIFSPISGVVIREKFSKTLGNFIAIYDAKNDLIHRFGHMKNRSLFDKGDRVCVGSVLGFQGNTGTSTGEHVHYDIIKNIWDNPIDYSVSGLLLQNYFDPAIFAGIGKGKFKKNTVWSFYKIWTLDLGDKSVDKGEFYAKKL